MALPVVGCGDLRPELPGAGRWEKATTAFTAVRDLMIDLASTPANGVRERESDTPALTALTDPANDPMFELVDEEPHGFQSTSRRHP